MKEETLAKALKLKNELEKFKNHIEDVELSVSGKDGEHFLLEKQGTITLNTKKGGAWSKQIVLINDFYNPDEIVQLYLLRAKDKLKKLQDEFYLL